MKSSGEKKMAMFFEQIKKDIFPEWDKSLWKENSRLERSESGIEFSFVEYVKS